MRREWQPNDIMFCGVTSTHPNDLTIKSCIWDMEDVLTVCPQTDNVGNISVAMAFSLSDIFFSNSFHHILSFYLLIFIPPSHLKKNWQFVSFVWETYVKFLLHLGKYFTSLWIPTCTYNNKKTTRMTVSFRSPASSSMLESYL